jgi:DNA invertase Pin-like site-specific DNA recombinase
MRIGYARCSSLSQSLEIQIETLTKYGCDKIFSEKVSGKSTDGREQLKEALQFVREGDELVICKLDRLCRSLLDLEQIVKQLSDKGVTLSCTDQAISTKDATSKAFVSMLGVFAELELSLRQERTRQGIERAKANGIYKGRKPTINKAMVKQLNESGLGASAIAKEMGINRRSVYRALEVG